MQTPINGAVKSFFLVITEESREDPFSTVKANMTRERSNNIIVLTLSL
jgi:hypothetical protein